MYEMCQVEISFLFLIALNIFQKKVFSLFTPPSLSIWL